MRAGSLKQLGWVPSIVLAATLMGCTHSDTPAPTAAADSGHFSNGAKPAGEPAAPRAEAVASAAPSKPEVKPGSDITGSWKWIVDAQGMQINHSAKFKQSGEALSGTWTDTFGDQTVTADVKDGSVKEGKVSFKVSRPSPLGDGGEMSLAFSGTLATSGDKIDGNINVMIPGGGDPIASEWHATRVKE